MRTHLRRALLGLTTTALVAGGTLVAAPAQAAHPRAESAADWLADQLDARSLVVSSYSVDGTTWTRYVDHGLTLDVLVALNTLDTRRGVRTGIVDAMESRVEKYVGTVATTSAGALGKLLTAAELEGRDPAAYAGGGLVDRLEALVRPSGRARDAGTPDYGNTVGQAWVVRALTAAASEKGDEAAGFLARQQCDDGGFRLYFGTADTCATSVDATALALQALMVAEEEGVGGLRDDIDEGVAWLVGRQRPGGAFREDGAANANSTGLAAETLARAGERGAAGTAAAWLRAHQVGGGVATRALAGEGGAVAFDTAALRAAQRDGIVRAVRYQWRRATAQGAAGLDALLRGTAVDVRAPRRAQPGARVTVVADGLLAGERYTVHRGERAVAGGWVPDDGTVVVEVRMPRSAGSVTVTVAGSRPNRSGVDTVRVR